MVMAPIPGIDMSMRRACFDVHLRQLAPKLGGTDANAAPGFKHRYHDRSKLPLQPNSGVAAARKNSQNTVWTQRP